MDQQGLVRSGLTLRLLSAGLAPVNKRAAARTAQSWAAAPSNLLVNSHIGECLDEFEPREVRRILVGHYEIRHEIQDCTTYVLRLWHARGDR